MKNFDYVVYRDIPDDGYSNNYELCQRKNRKNKEKQLIIKEQIIPGQFGFSDIYIRHLFLDNKLIISYTNYELTDTKKAEIMIVAAELFNEAQNTDN